jgi:hypothetical protein
MMLKEIGLRTLHADRPLGCFGLRIDRMGYPQLFRYANFYMSPGGLMIAFGTPGINGELELVDLTEVYEKHRAAHVEGYSCELARHGPRLHWAVDVHARGTEVIARLCAADAFWLSDCGIQLSEGTNGATLHFQPRCKLVDGGFNFAPNGHAHWCEYLPISERTAITADLL